MNNIIPTKEAIEKLSLTEKVGQLFMPAAFINDTEEEIQQLEKLISEHHVGGLCFFHSRASAATNFEGKKKIVVNENSFDTLKNLIKRYQKAATYPLLISIDAEWGLAMRIENTPQYPYAITLGSNPDNEALVFEVGKQIAKDCKTAGIHWNLSPVVDINTNPNNPVIGYRSFGDDKTNVVTMATAFVKGTQSEGVLTSIKHFPGHGDTATDSHLGLPVIDKSKEELIENELYPFQKLINEGVDSIMAGHLSVPALTTTPELPSSINKDIITGVLRNEMGFEGVVISDALNMHAVSKHYPIKGELEWLAFNAGNDVLCFAEHIEEGIQHILKNATETQINKSIERIWQLKEKAILKEDSTLKLTDPSSLNRKIAENSLTLHHGTAAEITAFKTTNFCTLTIKRFGADQAKQDILDNILEMKKEVEPETEILLLLTPPQIKPTNKFGFFDEEIQFINELITSKNVVLYHFGNPYALKFFSTEKTTATVIAYQNFKEFQDVATEHFLGSIEAKGKLPFNIEKSI
ncbi:glycoside hydrolase family 3 N-terminal domain-containing protein [Maribacter sp. BPC-D8]|uniref:glycoside hydrolase family 3 protein n=1 Tax=Maribacter sp. BPC-D8 TaxID=3053613 RepID=UPI002B4901B9|nr:glycoside hydrolase family 3 N-terminal domain-containing protein [Maribacter sp. BPC-D8]WRI31329.1 glycoside hydrolase family 3 N-terminal domain-containing protein [Maribacter sp. BPC-D8]